MALLPLVTLQLLGDWGGSPLWSNNYTTPQQGLCAAAMNTFAAHTPTHGILALGDNMYNLGICSNSTLAPYNNTCPNTTDPTTGTSHDQRFESTFENVYTGSSLLSLPFYVVAGNHDALGNVSASIARNGVGRWNHPNYYYKISPHPSLDVLMFDTTLCYGIWSDPVHDAMCAAQLTWLAQELQASTAPFLFVAGHYPMYSPCAHGNTQWAIDTLLPLLTRFNATGYLSGHDHCSSFLAPPTPHLDLVHVVSGMGDGCCYNESNILSVPSGSLKYLLSAGYNPLNAPSGFSTLSVTSQGGDGGGEGRDGNVASSLSLTFSFYSAANPSVPSPPLYTSPTILPRTPMPNGGAGMAAPNYAQAGIPRPSQVAPFQPYPNPPPGGEAPSVDTSGEPLPLPYLPAPSPASPELIIWLYAPTAVSNDTWSGWYSDLEAHRENVTGVSPCSYLVDGSGAFVSQMPTPQSKAMASFWTERMASELGLSAIPLIAASGTGMNRLIRAGNEGEAAAFIAATVAELRAINGSGYNLQLEEPGNATIQAAWEGFLGAWADALAPSTIAVIVGGDCRGRDWMYMDCGNYKELQVNHTNIRAITEATYEKYPPNWKDFEGNIVRGLGKEVAQLGLEYGPPLLNPANGCLPLARASGVTTLYVWVNTPEAGNTSQAAWDAFGWWVQGLTSSGSENE